MAAIEKKRNKQTEKGRKEASVGEEVEKLEPCTTLVGMQNTIVAVGNSVAIPQKIKHRISM